MSNVEALTHLQNAINEIEAAQQEAEREIAKTELENLWLMAEDCKSGLLTDATNDLLREEWSMSA